MQKYLSFHKNKQQNYDLQLSLNVSHHSYHSHTLESYATKHTCSVFSRRKETALVIRMLMHIHRNITAASSLKHSELTHK